MQKDYEAVLNAIIDQVFFLGDVSLESVEKVERGLFGEVELSSVEGREEIVERGDGEKEGDGEEGGEEREGGRGSVGGSGGWGGGAGGGGESGGGAGGAREEKEGSERRKEMASDGCV